VNGKAYKINLLGAYRVPTTLNVVDLSSFLDDDHLLNLRANSPQQGEDDGGPSMESCQDLQNSQGRSDSSSKVQGIVQTLLNQSYDPPNFDPVDKTDFVHLIS